MKTEKFDGRLTAPLSEFLSQKVAEGVARGRQPEGRRGSLPVSALDAADALADVRFSSVTVVLSSEVPTPSGEFVSGERYARASHAEAQ